ncbi:unnamed protein product [Rhizoctonia solani]|uniref:Uncharacterized protein n=1 Tax=Rhizoctonia solani TaxID=456999 RepID=A0A8H3CGA3_9AGAM|nr:unnamed protein product [Rhizoctonia solani]
MWDDLCIIGQLPSLESLDVVPHYLISTSEIKPKFKAAPLPSTVFPSLRNFALKGVIGASLFRWIWRLKPMVSGLLSAYISLPDYGSNSKSLDANLAHGQLIHKNSPNLTVLTINISSTSRVGALQIACELLSGVPVPTLVIKDWINGRVGDYPAAHSDSIFHHLRRLDLSTTFQPPNWATLPKIAKAFPNLEYLCMNPSTKWESYKPLDIGCISRTASQPIEIKLSVECTAYKETRDEEQWAYIRNDITK